MLGSGFSIGRPPVATQQLNAPCCSGRVIVQSRVSHRQNIHKPLRQSVVVAAKSDSPAPPSFQGDAEAERKGRGRPPKARDPKDQAPEVLERGAPIVPRVRIFNAMKYVAIAESLA